MKTAHVYVYGQIDYYQSDDIGAWGCVNLKSVKNQLDTQAGFDEIKVHIHSEGGDVTEGFAIYDFLISQGKPITTIVEGMCASIATIVALSGTTRQMTENSTFYIHNPWGFAGGEKEDLRRYADELEFIENKISDFYAKFTTIEKEEILGLMKVETSFTADEAVEKGFMTEVLGQIKAVALLKKENFKSKNEMSYTKKELDDKFKKSETMLEKIFNKLFGKTGPKALIVQDANGDDVDFPDLAEDAEPAVGDKATLDGSPIPDGDYVFPSLKNITITFVGGEVTVVGTAEEEEDPAEMEALKTEIANLKTENESLKTQNAKHDKESEESITAIKALKTEFDDLKKSVGSTYNYKAEKNGNQGDEQPTNGAKRTPIKK